MIMPKGMEVTHLGKNYKSGQEIPDKVAKFLGIYSEPKKKEEPRKQNKEDK